MSDVKTDEQIVVSIPLPLNVPLWWVGMGSRQVRVTCPECLGTCVVEMHLANGEKYSLDCGCCSSGFEGARGYVTETLYEYRPEPFTARRVRIDGAEFWYSESPPDSGHYSSVEASSLFRTREECEARCAERTAEQNHAREEMAVHQLRSKRKSLAFSVHYWRTQVAKLEKDLERARAQIHRCKKPKTEAA